jgi:hypothetical protein
MKQPDAAEFLELVADEKEFCPDAATTRLLDALVCLSLAIP